MMDDDDIKWIMKMIFGTLFVILVAPIVITAVARMIPPVLSGPTEEMPESAVYGQQWIDPVTGVTYVFTPKEGFAPGGSWVGGFG